MEGDGTSSSFPIHSSRQPSSSTAIYFCSICDKPFTKVNSRDRHFRYCGRHTRNRPRSCQACNAAKAKCSFEVDCSRCTKRGIECVYDTMITGGQRASPRSVSAAHTVMVEPCKRPSSLPTSGSSCAVDGISPDGHFAFADNLDINDAQLQPISGTNWQPVDLTSGELFAFEDETFNQYQSSASVSLSLQHGLDQQSGSWCAWMRGNVSLAVVTENPLARSHSNLSAVFLSGRPHAQHNAELIIQSLRSFPTMMLRRETFPWFIHPQSQLVLGSRDAALPEALSNCMSIAQMFASRTFETKNFLRQTIKAEYCRFAFEMYNMSKFELLAVMQACMMYLIMYIIDYSSEDEGNARELLLVLLDLYLLFKDIGGRCANEIEASKASMKWKDWIFAESQRRFANLWLLVGCVVCVKNGNVCDASQSYRTLPLPSPKSLWEAPTESAWESEYEACRIFQTSGLETLGDLIDAQQSDYTPSNARKLDIWNAGVDSLGCLLNLVGSMV